MPDTPDPFFELGRNATKTGASFLTASANIKVRTADGSTRPMDEREARIFELGWWAAGGESDA